MEGRVPEVFSLFGAIGPGGCEGAEEMFIGITDPEAGFRGEPVQATEPADGWIQAGVIEHFGFVAGPMVFAGGLPFVSVPLPEALIQLAAGEQAQADGVVVEFEDELGSSGVSDAELFPLTVFGALVFAQVREQTVAEFLDWQDGFFRPGFEQCGRRRIAQEIDGMLEEEESGLAGEESGLAEGEEFAGGQLDLVSEGKFAVIASEMGFEFGELAVKTE